MIAGAGINIDDFNSAFHDCRSPDQAAALVNKFQFWVRHHAPLHPVCNLEIIHIAEAMTTAGLDLHGGTFAPELADDDEYNEEEDCLADRDTWLAWLKNSNAVHSCNWRDAGTLAQDIADAIEQGADILVLQRVS
jgi:hypothetical protein